MHHSRLCALLIEIPRRKRRVRWLTKEEVTRLLQALPPHQRQLARFALATGLSAWKNALRRAGIEHFRWHDLRHVWATWHVMAGTTLGELQELGAWKSEAMVRRYAHFAPEQLRKAADRLTTFWYTAPKKDAADRPQAVESLVGRGGIEPTTNGLRVGRIGKSNIAQNRQQQLIQPVT